MSASGPTPPSAITVVLSSAGGTGAEQQQQQQQAAALPPGVRSYAALLEFARGAFNQPAGQALTISDGANDVTADEHVQRLQPGQRLLVRPAGAADAPAVFTERISFDPHPKTLTMAGDYEYFAAQGHHPLAFALAELIDNALRATKANDAAGRRRAITVSLATDERAGRGLVAVRDNGCGMGVSELGSWAVMNLSMEDRGLLPSNPGAADEGKPGCRYLSSDISYFGVGSKNAAFYLGRTVKVVTKTADSGYVHELAIQAAELERRYREGQAVYEEDMLHRQPGDASSLAAYERPFPAAQAMLQQEVAGAAEADGSPAADAGNPAGNPAASTSSAAGSFTRVLIYDLKPDVLGQLTDEAEGQAVLRDLAHLYHYYLHGARGNTFTSHATHLPNGEAVPDIRVERLRGGQQLWCRRLVEVEDDLESRYLAAARDSLEFALSVPNRGRVEGVLWYFPFENDAETVPLDAHTMGRMLLTRRRSDGLTQPGSGGVLTQAPPPSQAPGCGGAGDTQARPLGDGEGEAEGANYTALLAACPTFEAFWQGRLIPGACVDSLPFIRAVRTKRTAAGKDLLPDEVFARIRGALFFGPGFRVTRNKLTFRDNLALLLEGASPTDRQQERRLKEWLARCHRQLDRSVRFEQLCAPATQHQGRKELGDVTLFERVHDGMQHIQKGDHIRLNTKPATIGRVLHFCVPQVVTAEGCYSGGRVTVVALPEELLGPDNRHTWPLRRVEGKVGDAELREHEARELAKLPAELRFEPMKLVAGSMVVLPAGGGLPDTSISVLNGSGGKVTRAMLAGKREQLRVVQTLYYLGPAGSGRKRSAAASAQGGASGCAAASAPGLVPSGAEEPAAAGRKAGGSKRGKRRKKGAAAAEAGDKENEQPAGTDAGDEAAAAAAGAGKQAGADAELLEAQQQLEEGEPVPEGEVLLSYENKSPIQDSFGFKRITSGLTRAGCYVLQYSLLPALPSGHTLRRSIELQVNPGPPVTFGISGEGRAIAQSRALMLGEALPHLALQFADAHGNTVPASAVAAQQQGSGLPAVQLQVLHEAGINGGGAVLEELHVAADMELEGEQLWVSNLRLLGPDAPAPGSGGMQLFKPRPAPGAGGSAAGSAASEQHCGAAPPAGLPLVRAVEVFLAAHVDGMPPQGFPVRLAPGAPHSLRLLHGHPFAGTCSASQQQEQGPLLTQLAPAQQLVPAEVMSGEELATFKVQALDVWGNATCPNEQLPFEVAIQCAAADPPSSSAAVDDRGVAVISRLCMMRTEPASPDSSQAGSPARCQEPGGQPQPHQLQLWPAWGEACGAQPLLQHALQLALPREQLALQLLVQPSTRPAELLMLCKGEQLARRMTDGPDGPDSCLVWQLAGVEAGSRVEGLVVRCVDEVGRPAASGISGKIQVSWAKGSKKATLCGDDIRLPPLQAPDAVGQPAPFWVRFIGDPRAWPGVSFDIQLEVAVAPGPPASWSVAIVDYARGAGAGAAMRQGAGGGGGEALSAMPCGQPFYLEIEALDACNNRCCFSSASERPTPVVLAEPEDAEGVLQLEPDTWQHKWDNTQAGGDVCLFKLWLAGPPGPVKLVVADKAGEGGASLLAPDELLVQLLPGPAAALVADCPQQLECSTRGWLDMLPVKAVDAFGNPVEDAAFEVSLNGSAFNADGVAARVAAAGSNRAKLRGGVACFKGVRLAAPMEGLFKLTVSCVSRKLVVQEAVLMVKVAQQNFVTNLEVLPASLPGADGQPALAGAGSQLLVALQIEDGRPLPWEAVTEGLSLRLEPPLQAQQQGSGTVAAVPGRGRGGRGGAPRRPDAVVLEPERLWEPPGDGEAAGGDDAAAAAAAEAASRGCVAVFAAHDLTAAGSYTVTAEYAETRAELLPGLTKQEQALRSTSQRFELAAGPAVSAQLQGGGTDAEELSISNGQDAAQRRLLRNVAVQLVDAHGNAVEAAGVQVRWRLLCADADTGGGGGDAEAPQLCCSGGEVQMASDEQGRAFFGDVAVEQGTGKMPHDVAGQGLQCSVELQLLLAKSKGRRSSNNGSAWVSVWSRLVLFCDDAARIRQLQALQEQREQVQQQLAAVRDSLQEVHHRVACAQAEHATACRAASSRLATLGERLRRPEQQLPGSSAEARELAAALRQQAAAEPDRPVLSARYGSPRSPLAASITRLLHAGDADVVGVFAQLCYVDNARLSEVLGANYCSAMQVLVVRSYEAIARLRSVAEAAKVPVPSMLSYTLIQEFQEGVEQGCQTVLRGVSPLAQQLMADACEGTDAPLGMPLPHTRQIAAMQRSGHAVPPGLAADEWPAGCLGYAVNLIRPAISGTRKGLLYAQLGRTLVFEAVHDAAQYRHHVIKALRGNVPDIVSLDRGKLSGRGVVLGSAFKVAALEEAPFRFGNAPPAQQGGGGGASLTQREAAAEAAAEALQQQEEAAEALQAAEAELGQPEQQELQQQAAELEAQLHALSERIRQQRRGGGGGGSGGNAPGAAAQTQACGGGKGGRPTQRGMPEQQQQQHGSGDEDGGGGGDDAAAAAAQQEGRHRGKRRRY